jgi:muramoyltetrapeptide carboxypeptidase
MIAPPRLRAGSRVALVAPAGPVTAEKIETALRNCRHFGFEPRLGRHARGRAGYLAGADADRLADLREAIESAEIDAIWALRGGYGTMRILPQLDLAPLTRRPKVFIGFSDNTVFHLAAARLGLVTFHGPHAGATLPPLAEASFRRVLFEAAPGGTLPGTAESPPRTLIGGTAEGPLIGGNLAMLASCAGTGCALEARGAILVIEDIGEPLYRIDRLLTQLRLSGALDGVAGCAIGQFTDCDVEGGTAELDALFIERLGGAGIPIVAGLPFGHVDLNWTLPFGVRTRIDADRGTLTLLEAAVT